MTTDLVYAALAGAGFILLAMFIFGVMRLHPFIEAMLLIALIRFVIHPNLLTGILFVLWLAWWLKEES